MLYLSVSLSEVAVKLDVLRDVHRFSPHKLQQGSGQAGVPGADSLLGFHQISPSALQIGGWGAVQGHVGQLVIEHGVMFGFDAVTLSFSHQTLGDQLLGIGVRYALTGPVRTQRSTWY